MGGNTPAPCQYFRDEYLRLRSCPYTERSNIQPTDTDRIKSCMSIQSQRKNIWIATVDLGLQHDFQLCCDSACFSRNQKLRSISLEHRDQKLLPTKTTQPFWKHPHPGLHGISEYSWYLPKKAVILKIIVMKNLQFLKCLTFPKYLISSMHYLAQTQQKS